jgi:hypothetical protein
MNMSSNYNQVLSEVRKAYADCQSWKNGNGLVGMEERELDFLANLSVSPAEAKQILIASGVTSYNDFDPMELDKFDPEDRVLIAREGSVCLYVHWAKKPNRNIRADEVSEAEINGIKAMRYWWD